MAKKKEKKKKAASTNYKTGPPLLQSACKPFFFFHSRSWRHRSGENHTERRKTAGKETAAEFIEGVAREP